MSNRPIKSFKSGQIELAAWSGEYQGKPTTSFTMSKRAFNKQTNAWEEKKYFSPTDLKDIQAVCTAAVVDGILNRPEKQQFNPQVNQSNGQKNIKQVFGYEDQSFPPAEEAPW